MGTWGTSISSNDTFADVYDSFFIYYNDDWEISLIIKQLKKDYQETLDIDDDSNNFWFALAQALWECKAPDKSILRKVKTIIDEGVDLKIWKKLEASDNYLKKRKAVLNKFLYQILTPKERAKARKKIKTKVISPIFDKGDCIIFKMKNGNYGGALVYEADRNSEYGYNFIAATTINKKGKPTLPDFEIANILTIWEKKIYGKIEDKITREQPIAYWFQANNYKEFANKFLKIGNLKVTKKISHSFLGHFEVWIPWDVLIVFSQQAFEKISSGQKQRRIIATKDWRT